MKIKSIQLLKQCLVRTAKEKGYNVDDLHDLNQDELDHIFYVVQKMLTRTKEWWITPQ